MQKQNCKLFKLTIILISCPRRDFDAVFRLQSKVGPSIINNEDFIQISSQDSQVFDQHSFIYYHMVSKQSKFYKAEWIYSS